MIDKKAAYAFLNAYQKLVLKFGYCIDACSCCDGPQIFPIETSEHLNHFDHFKRILRDKIDDERRKQAPQDGDHAGR